MPSRKPLSSTTTRFTKKKAVPSSEPDQKYRLRSYNEIPNYLKGNPYVRFGYRPQLTISECLRSVLSWNNETLNIWTHLLGSVYFAYIVVYDWKVTAPRLSFNAVDKLIWTYYNVSCFISTITSSLYHTLCCHSKATDWFFLKLDVAGVLLAFSGSFTIIAHVVFGCYEVWRLCYYIANAVLILVILTLHVRCRARYFVHDRVLCTVVLVWAVVGLLPPYHWMYLAGGFENPVVVRFLPYPLMKVTTLGIAFFFYVTRYPEKCCPGKMDYVGASHQLWHIFAFAAMFIWNIACVKFRESTSVNGCWPGTN